MLRFITIAFIGVSVSAISLRQDSIEEANDTQTDVVLTEDDIDLQFGANADDVEIVAYDDEKLEADFSELSDLIPSMQDILNPEPLIDYEERINTLKSGQKALLTSLSDRGVQFGNSSTTSSSSEEST